MAASYEYYRPAMATASCHISITMKRIVTTATRAVEVAGDGVLKIRKSLLILVKQCVCVGV